MKNLKEYLINLDVIFQYQIEEEILEIPCKVSNVIIETFYFEEKNEPIYISVNLSPIESLYELEKKYGINKDKYDIFNNVCLSQITKL